MSLMSERSWRSLRSLWQSPCRSRAGLEVPGIRCTRKPRPDRKKVRGPLRARTPGRNPGRAAWPLLGLRPRPLVLCRWSSACGGRCATPCSFMRRPCRRPTLAWSLPCSSRSGRCWLRPPRPWLHQPRPPPCRGRRAPLACPAVGGVGSRAARARLQPCLPEERLLRPGWSWRRHRGLLRCRGLARSRTAERRWRLSAPRSKKRCSRLLSAWTPPGIGHRRRLASPLKGGKDSASPFGTANVGQQAVSHDHLRAGKSWSQLLKMNLWMMSRGTGTARPSAKMDKLCRGRCTGLRRHLVRQLG
mmetsp:Transcript_19834/g.57556  ORF Transcript_19834/g.57556 Transcript_19834/m.57556 type:complete len:302 (-) Transcript_19834:110-1015(-)